jgi:outer membrane protein assembly factor BamB
MVRVNTIISQVNNNKLLKENVMRLGKKTLLLIAIASGFFCNLSFTKAEPEIKWSVKTGGAVYSSPLCFNGNIYIGSDDSKLYCIDASTGTKIWEFKTGGIIRCRPAVFNGNILFTSDDGNLYCVNSESGNKVWAINIGNNITRVLPSLSNAPGDIYWDYMQSSPCVDNETIYIGSGDSCMYAVDAKSGSLKWKMKTGSIIRSSPCVYDGSVYVGSFDGFIYAFNESNGSKVWAFNAKGQYNHVQPSPRVVDGIVYCGARNPFFYAIDARTGREIWKQSFDFSWVESSAAVVDGKVYVGSSDLRKVFSFDAKSGHVNWELKVPGDTWSSPCYDDGTLYIGLAGYGGRADTLISGSILAVNAVNGEEKWKVDCGTSPFIGGIVSSPAVYDGIVFYGSLDGKIYAVKSK